MTGGGARLCLVSIAMALCLTGSRGDAAAPDLTGVTALAHVYDDILDARFEQAEADLGEACPPAPPEACDVMASTITWWRIQMDPDSRALDDRFIARTDRAIAATEAWAARDALNAEAHFYAGAAYAVRVQWRVLRGDKLAAARDGKRIRQALERAVALDPQLEDAYFGIGLYQYYADVAPATAKILRFLLMLPGGDRVEGLAQMRRARARGQLLQGEADYQLQIIYLWYEHRTDLAVDLLGSLRDRYPDNPLFPMQLADVQDRYEHDLTASLGTWRGLLAAARDRRVNEPALAETEARLGVARQLDALYQTDRALDQLRLVVADEPRRPWGALAEAYLALGAGEDRLGYREAATAAYGRAIAAAPPHDDHGVRKEAAGRLQHAPDERRAEAYRLQLEGLRQLEERDPDEAARLLARSIALDPRDPVARYRSALVLLAQKHPADALTQFEAAIVGARNCPAPIAAAAYLEAARLHERLSHTDRAIEYYRAASTWFGAGRETKTAASAALARLLRLAPTARAPR